MSRFRRWLRQGLPLLRLQQPALQMAQARLGSSSRLYKAFAAAGNDANKNNTSPTHRNGLMCLNLVVKRLATTLNPGRLQSYSWKAPGQRTRAH